MPKDQSRPRRRRSLPRTPRRAPPQQRLPRLDRDRVQGQSRRVKTRRLPILPRRKPVRLPVSRRPSQQPNPRRQHRRRRSHRRPQHHHRSRARGQVLAQPGHRQAFVTNLLRLHHEQERLHSLWWPRHRHRPKQPRRPSTEHNPSQRASQDLPRKRSTRSPTIGAVPARQPRHPWHRRGRLVLAAHDFWCRGLIHGQ